MIPVYHVSGVKTSRTEAVLARDIGTAVGMILAGE